MVGGALLEMRGKTETPGMTHDTCSELREKVDA